MAGGGIRAKRLELSRGISFIDESREYYMSREAFRCIGRQGHDIPAEVEARDRDLAVTGA
jgi:hypothetical protein